MKWYCKMQSHPKQEDRHSSAKNEKDYEKKVAKLINRRKKSKDNG